MFADDTTLFSSSLQNLNNQIQIINEYSKLSGSKLNTKKSIILPLNQQQNINISQYENIKNMNIINENSSHKVLGIHQNINISKEEQIQFIIEKFKQQVIIYTNRARTTKGRVIILQSLILSTLYFIAQNLPFEKNIIQNIYKYSINFIKNSINPDHTTTIKINQISKNWIEQTKEKGGLNIQKIKQTFECFEIKKALNLINIVYNEPNSKLKSWMKLNWSIEKFFNINSIIWWTKKTSQIEYYLNREIYNKDYEKILINLEKIRDQSTIIVKNQTQKNQLINNCPIWNQLQDQRTILSTFYRKKVKDKIIKIIQNI